MKKFVFLALITNLIFLSACAGETAVKPVNTTNANSPNTNVVAQTENTNPAPVIEEANIGVNRLNKRAVTNVNSNLEIPGAVEDSGVPAPFNSTVRSTMSKQNKFLEIRAFKGDPILLRVEREQESRKIRAFLKNGKVVEIDYEKGEKLFMTGSPDDILIAAGVKKQ